MSFLCKSSPIMSREITNKKASFRYHLLESFTAGIVLSGSEIKSIRAGKANITDAYCKWINGEFYVINLYIAPYENAGYSQHKERRERKLLMTVPELRKLDRKMKDAGVTVIPTRLFINNKGWAKLDVSLATGKTAGDKRISQKEKDLKRERDRGE